ncbi:MAG TPA: thymidylate kinase, partial [Afipia sp.]
DRFEGEGLAFHEKLREAYLQIAKNNPDRCALIDANADANTVAARVWAALRDHLFSVATVRETTKA